MQRALELAARGMNSTRPNPRVGCVITKDERILSEAWHERAGSPHAEVLALAAVGNDAAGATVYVTLEPCNHFGRTGPCTAALIAAGIKRVVFAVTDPNSHVAGGGAAALRAAGIEVQDGLLAQAATELNVGFFKRLQSGKPWVRIKIAASLDGRTALADGTSQWITATPAREDVQQWRARSCAVLTGSGTVSADDPRLTVRVAQQQPLRVILDSQLRTAPSARIFSEAGEILIFTQETRDSQRLARADELRRCGARIEMLPTTPLDLSAVLQRLAELEINELLIEAGPTLSGALLNHSLADELLVYLAPKVLGSHAKSMFDMPALTALTAAPRFKLCECLPLGEDLRVRWRSLERS